MLFTLLNWLYIFITCYICGSFVLSRILHGERIPSVYGSVFCGIAILTAFSEYFSLFSGVGLIANLILIVACLLFVFMDADRYRKLLKSFAAEPVVLIISALPVLVCAYFTSASAFTYDTGTYHAQSIHWIETYGVVKGLAHMQTRLGFNNSYFSLCALYSFGFLGQSMHAVSGFLAAFVMVCSIRGYAGHFKRKVNGRDLIKDIKVSDLLRLAPFAYFVITAYEITSPSTDYGVIWMIIWLVIRWAECIEEGAGDHRIEVFSLLSVFSVFLVTVKLSVGVLALITLYPLVFLIREKKYGDIIKYVTAGLVLTLPFFIRNYLITGWLVYPFPAIDLFDPDWKVPLEGVKHEADEVVVWARYTKDTALIDQTIREWFPVWWEEQGQANRFMSKSAFAGCIVTLIRLAAGLIEALSGFTGKKAPADGGDGKDDDRWAYMFLGGVLFICFVFFMGSAPSNRFGYAYILMIPLYAVGDLCLNLIPDLFERIKDKYPGRIKGAAWAVISCLVVFTVLSGFARGLRIFASDDKKAAMNTGISGYLITQKDYPMADALSEEWEGMTVYYPVNEGEQIWYHAFPAILYRGNLDGTMRRGDSVRDGFKLK